MSWLNNSFNTLKGQLSNLAQEVLQEVQAPTDEELYQQQQQQSSIEQPSLDGINSSEFIEESQRKINELNQLCGSKDNEIILLRKQINDLQSRSSSKSTSEKNEILEDSWCWEPDEVSSTQQVIESISTTNTAVSSTTAAIIKSIDNDPNSESSSSGGAEIVNIPLDSPKRNSRTDDKLNKKFNKLQQENKILNETIQKLTNENDDLNRNLDELDTQHNLAIENVLEAKRDIQKKLTVVTKDYDNQRKKTQEGEKKLQSIREELTEVNDKLEKLQDAYAEYATENVLLKTNLEQSRIESDAAKNENLKFKDLLEQKGKELLELIEKVENDFGNEREEENALLKKKLQALAERLDELEAEKKNFEKSESSASSTSGKQSLDGGFIVVDDDHHHHQNNWEQKYNELLSEKSKRETEFVDLERLLKDWEAKYALLQAENSNFMAKIEELKSAKTVDPNRFNELKRENEQVRQDLEAASIEYMDYQDEQIAIRKELDDKILSLEDKILDLQDRNSTLETENQDQIFKIDNLSRSKLSDTESFEKLLTEKQKSELDYEESNVVNKELLTELEQQKIQYESKIADLENEVKILTQSRRNSPEQVPSSDLIDMERLRSENEAFLIKISELSEKITKCEANASDVEAKMLIENVNLQKSISDLQLALSQNSSDSSKISKSEDTKNNSIEFDDLKKWFSTYVQTDIEINDTDSIEGAFKTIKDRFWKIEVLEKNLKQMSDEILKSNSERTKLQHEVSTLNADIENYKIECEELLKNNRILLDELENYQSSKLPAISEHNEESLVQLEKQLEDIKDLNKKLDEEFKQLNQKFEETELEKEESLNKIQSLQDINTNLKTQIENLHKQLDAMELEKCNLIFEINEMKTDDKKSAVDAELFEHKAKISNLEQQLDRLSKDHTELLNTVQPQQSSLAEAKKDNERLEKLLRERDLVVLEKEKEIEKFQNEFEILQSKLIEESSTEDDKQNLVTDLDRLENEKKSLQEALNKVQAKVETSRNLISDLTSEIDKLNSENSVLKSKNDEHSATIKHSDEELIQLRQCTEALNVEKVDIIKTLQMKHQENLQYYNEIQRLSHLIESITEKTKNSSECEKCKIYQADIELRNDQIEKLQEQVKFLKEKYDILTTNLLTEQTNQKLLQEENKDLIEQKLNMSKDLERLQQHLVDLEESHTQEILEMQSKLNNMQQKMRSMEEDISKSSTALTSASIRANQQAETLQAQYLLVTQQRDELATKISLAEDRELKNQAALVNLQCALEQFQKEKQKDINLATAKIRKELKYEKDVQNALKTEIAGLKDQLADANQGLLAASRISDQLEGSKETILSLREEIERLQNESIKLKEKINTTESSQADKIEKSLIKSLIIGYIVSATANDKNQILKVITTVLDFDQTETDKLGLNKQQLGWFGSLMGTGTQQGQNKDSLVEAFVNFLERESQPRNDPKTLPNLLNIVTENPSNIATAKERKLSHSSTTSTTSTASTNIRSSNTSTVQPILYNDNVLSDFAPTRNSSSILKDILSDS